MNAALIVEPDDPGGDPRQNRFRESGSLAELAVGFDQASLLSVDLAGHAVEGAAQDTDLMARRRRLDACRQVALSHPFGDRDQVADGTHQLGRQGEADPHRR